MQKGRVRLQTGINNSVTGVFIFPRMKFKLMKMSITLKASPLVMDDHVS